MPRALCVLFVLVFSQACTSSYEPARSPRIATVIDGGQPTFVKDGVHFGSQVWGTGLVDAVHGNPRAEHHARVGRNLIAGGFVLSLVGVNLGFYAGVTGQVSMLAILVSLIGVVLAVLNLVLDFDYIERGVQMGAPASESWRGAFGLTVTMVWLYIEILRILAILRGSN